MSRRCYKIDANKPLPLLILALLAALMNEGTAKAKELQKICKGYAPTSIITALSCMHNHLLVQHLPGSFWGLTKAGIEQLAKAEKDVLDASAANIAREEARLRAMSPRRQLNAQKIREKEREQHIGVMRRQGEII